MGETSWLDLDDAAASHLLGMVCQWMESQGGEAAYVLDQLIEEAKANS